MIDESMTLLYCKRINNGNYCLTNNDFCDSCNNQADCINNQPELPIEAPLYCAVNYGQVIRVGKWGRDADGVWIELNKKYKSEEEDAEEIATEYKDRIEEENLQFYDGNNEERGTVPESGVENVPTSNGIR